MNVKKMCLLNSLLLNSLLVFMRVCNVTSIYTPLQYMLYYCYTVAPVKNGINYILEGFLGIIVPNYA